MNPLVGRADAQAPSSVASGAILVESDGRGALRLASGWDVAGVKLPGDDTVNLGVGDWVRVVGGEMLRDTHGPRH